MDKYQFRPAASKPPPIIYASCWSLCSIKDHTSDASSSPKELPKSPNKDKILLADWYFFSSLSLESKSFSAFEILSEGYLCQTGVTLLLTSTLINKGFITSEELYFPVISNNINGDSGIVLLDDNNVYNFTSGKIESWEFVKENATVFQTHKLNKNKLTEPLFDTELYVSHIEQSYLKAHDNYLLGNDPVNINISPWGYYLEDYNVSTVFFF